MPTRPTRQDAGFFRSDSVRRIESQWLATTGPGELMDRAATALADLADHVLRDCVAGTPVVAMVGPGNNGGDALLALSKLSQRGYTVRAFLLNQNEPAAADAAAVYKSWRAAGGSFENLADLPVALGDTSAVILDGLFGIGLSRPLDAVAARVAQWSHRIKHPVIAADVPSGLNADNGSVVGGVRATAVRATHTVTFIADKPGLHTGRGPDLAGTVQLATLGLTPEKPDGLRIDRSWVAARLTQRLATSHKGSFGTVAVVGGATGMHGAALLAAQGARAVGAGKVATIGRDGPVFDPGDPQLMAWSVERPVDLDNYLNAVSAVAIGCGLGTGGAARNLLNHALNAGLPLVIDADALNVIADDSFNSGRSATPASSDNNPAGALATLLAQRSAHTPTVLTPHPLEAARLLNKPVSAVQENRIDYALALASQFNTFVLLKGAGTVLAAPDKRWAIIAAGSPALATGGTGDVLAGMVAGLLSQTHSAWEAAAVAAWVHGDAGNRWSLVNPMNRGLQSGELIERIVESINHCKPTD